jgi:AcrR family transcriptional regulator
VARAGLSRAAVVDLALSVVDDGGPRGFEDLTLAAVAARTGVAVPSLYKHVSGLPELRRAVALVSVQGLTAAIRDAVSRAATPTGAPALRAAAAAVRTYARAAPGRYGAVQGGTWTRDPHAADVQAAAAETVAVIAAVLSPFDVAPENAVDAVRAVRAALHGFVMLELGGGFGMPQDVDQSFGFLVEALVTALSRD